jgi:hypothetical protein
MGLKARVGKAVQKRIEAMPSIQAEKERSERIAPVQRAAWKAAYGAPDDASARVALRDRLQAGPDILAEATIDLSRRRDDYIHDRAYRLLSAAAADTAVQPIAPERQVLFAEEESIGRIPIEQAFQRLAELQPRLLDVKRAAEIGDPGADAEERGLPKHLRQMLHGLVGAGSSGDHDLIRTNLATSIVHQYWEQLRGRPRAGDPQTAYFDSPTKQIVTSVAFGRNRPGT